jgi:hypothetical protein
MPAASWCPACATVEPLNHRVERLENVMADFLWRFAPEYLFRSPPWWRRWCACADAVGRSTLSLLRRVGWARLNEADRTMARRTQLVLDVARRQGYRAGRLCVLGARTPLCVVERGSHWRCFEVLPRGAAGPWSLHLDDKAAFRSTCAALGLPVAPGGVTRTFAAAQAIATSVGYPVVVKPRSGSRSRHVTVGVRDTAALRSAFDSARRCDWKVIVERHVPGDVLRMTVVGGRLIAAALRQPLSGEWRVTLEAGARITDVSDELHPTIVAAVERLAAALEVQLVGFDAIAADYRRPITDAPFAFIEANGLPFIEMHHAPTVGQPRDVAGALLDLLLGS